MTTAILSALQEEQSSLLQHLQRALAVVDARAAGDLRLATGTAPGAAAPGAERRGRWGGIWRL